MQLLRRLVTAVKFLWGHLRDPESQTYYPEQERKSRIQICLDNFRWILRYREINHFYYLYGFDRKNGVNQDDYLAKCVFNELRHKTNEAVWVGGRRASYVCLLQDKFLFGQYLKALGFPTPRITALCDNQSITWLDSKKKEPLESLLHRGDQDVFLKELVGGSAEGVYPVKVRGGKLFLCNREITIEELRDIMQGKCIIQKRICQHPRMSTVYPHSVNTLRIVTVNTGRDVVLLSAFFRSGVNDREFDNWSAGGIAVGIDLETGRLRRDGVYGPEYGRRVERHPNTNIEFEGFEIPYFAEAIWMTIGLHGFFYGVHSVGWDIAITEDGPVFLEGNNRWDMPILQALDKDLKKKYLATVSGGSVLSQWKLKDQVDRIGGLQQNICGIFRKRLSGKASQKNQGADRRE